MHIVEFRRTFSASDCSTGEVYIDGFLKALFYSSASLFSKQLTNQPILTEGAVSEVFVKTVPHLLRSSKGARIPTSAGGSIRLIAIDGESYWQYQRPRKKARALPSDVILVGTKLFNRECRISSKGEDAFFESNYYYAWASDIIAQSLFDGKFSRSNYQGGIKSESLIIFSDASEPRKMIMGGVVATTSPPRDAETNISAGDPCLTKAEHMANTIVQKGGAKSYQRRDDIWFCPTGTLIGASGSNIIEMEYDLRYWSFVSDEICGNILGIPVNRRYRVDRTEYGKGSAAWARCFATDEWKKISNEVMVVAN